MIGQTLRSELFLNWTGSRKWNVTLRPDPIFMDAILFCQDERHGVHGPVPNNRPDEHVPDNQVVHGKTYSSVNKIILFN